MSEKYLGKHFDIHGGGLDLVFPHHENEIAQSCCSNKNDKFANYWIHNGFVTLNKEKMSKSVGNIVSIKNLSKKINGQVIRLALLSSHYKQPLDWNDKLISECKNTLNKWYKQFDKIDPSKLNKDIISPLLEDLNTPEYISKLHYLYEESSKGNNLAKIQFLNACNLIGLLEEDKNSWENFKKSKVNVDENFINKKIKDRNNARSNGDYQLADIIRNELEIAGIVIEDKQDQTTWKYK
jgi:cysteinyl-tRNA synthetase